MEEGNPGHWCRPCCTRGWGAEERGSDLEGSKKGSWGSSSTPPTSHQTGGRWRGEMSSNVPPVVAAATGGEPFDAAYPGNGQLGSFVREPLAKDCEDRWRELFPLPFEPEPERVPGASTSSRRRRAKVRERVRQVNSLVGCLNEMYLSDQRVSPEGITRAQQASHHFLFKQVKQQKLPTSSVTEREAVQELLRCDITYNGDNESTTVLPYDRDRVSLPDCGASPVVLQKVLDDVGREVVARPLDNMMVSEEMWGEIIEHGDTFRPYMDKILQKDASLYRVFIMDLFEKGMIDFTDRPQDLVTPFFVRKKNGKLRFILDCRGVNRRFKPPPPIALAAGSTWSQVVVPESQNLYVAQSDIRDYFFSLELPPDLKSLFCLPSVEHSILQDLKIDPGAMPAPTPEGLTFPRLKVVPMGWSWAMWVAQRVHQQISLISSGLGEDRVLVEGKPCPDLSQGEPIIIPYADNLNVAGADADRVQQAKDRVVAALRQLGFRVHEEMDAQSTAQSLGFFIDGLNGIICPIPERLDKIRKVFAWLAKRPRVNGRAVERLIGHAVHICLLRRELLSIFRTLYDFVYANYDNKTKLWSAAAKEARWASELLVLCSVNVRKGWSQDITSSDASLSGIAVSRRPLNEVAQKEIGSVKEIWRFKSNFDVKPRSTALPKSDPFSDPVTVKPEKQQLTDPFALDDSFPEIPAEVLQSDCWHDVFSTYMQYPEHITLLEGRGIVAAIRHKLRSTSEFGRHHLHLNDNMGAVLLCSKGRSGTFGMLRISRRIAALVLAADISFHCRWIPSELNHSDKASRRWEHLRVSNAEGRARQEDRKKEIADRCYPRIGQQDDALPAGSWRSVHRHFVQKESIKKNAPDQGREEALSTGEVECQEGQEAIQGSNQAGATGSFSAGGAGLSEAGARVETFLPSKTVWAYLGRTTSTWSAASLSTTCSIKDSTFRTGPKAWQPSSMPIQTLAKKANCPELDELCRDGRR